MKKEKRVINIPKEQFDAIKNFCDENALDMPKWMVKNSFEKINRVNQIVKTQDTLNKLKSIISYYNTTRQVGHTFRMLNGVLSIPYKYTSPIKEGIIKTEEPHNCIILTHNNDMANYINNTITKCVGESSLKNAGINIYAKSFTDDSLRGHNSQILIDNALLYILFSDCINAIENSI